MKNFSTLLASLFLAVSFSSCQESKDVKPTIAPVGKSANYTTDGPPERTLLGSTNKGKVYASIGTEAQLASALAVLDAHPETSYTGFDTNQVYSLTVPGVSQKGYVFASTSNTSTTQRVLAILDFDTPSARPIIVETTSQSVTYIDPVKEWKTTVVNGPNGIQATTSDISGIASRRAPCGDGTATCIQHAYSNNGWISVWAFVQTAFIPWTAVGIALDCAIHNC